MSNRPWLLCLHDLFAHIQIEHKLDQHLHSQSLSSHHLTSHWAGLVSSHGFPRSQVVEAPHGHGFQAKPNCEHEGRIFQLCGRPPPTNPSLDGKTRAVAQQRLQTSANSGHKVVSPFAAESKAPPLLLKFSEQKRRWLEEEVSLPRAVFCKHLQEERNVCRSAFLPVEPCFLDSASGPPRRRTSCIAFIF